MELKNLWQSSRQALFSLKSLRFNRGDFAAWRLKKSPPSIPPRRANLYTHLPFNN